MVLLEVVPRLLESPTLFIHQVCHADRDGAREPKVRIHQDTTFGRFAFFLGFMQEIEGVTENPQQVLVIVILQEDSFVFYAVPYERDRRIGEIEDEGYPFPSQELDVLHARLVPYQEVRVDLAGVHHLVERGVLGEAGVPACPRAPSPSSPVFMLPHGNYCVLGFFGMVFFCISRHIIFFAGSVGGSSSIRSYPVCRMFAFLSAFVCFARRTYSHCDTSQKVAVEWKCGKGCGFYNNIINFNNLIKSPLLCSQICCAMQCIMVFPSYRTASHNKCKVFTKLFQQYDATQTVAAILTIDPEIWLSRKTVQSYSLLPNKIMRKSTQK